MTKLMRRVALVLALPLVIGAAVVLLASPAHAALTFTEVAVSDSTPVYGQEVLATATVLSEEEPVTVGTVQFLVQDPAGEFTQFGNPVPLNAAGRAVSAPVPQQDGTPMDVTVGSDFYLVRPTTSRRPRSSTPRPTSLTRSRSAKPARRSRCCRGRPASSLTCRAPCRAAYRPAASSPPAR